jgi:energy-coupling factor transporter ATP-binding protein EcfA2
MLTKLIIRNFKRFKKAEVELGSPVVFVGPNNSGKSTALQALALWDLGLKRWLEKRGGKKTPDKRPGVTLNRRDLFSIPIPDANHLWRELHVRDVTRDNGKPKTKNVRIEIIVEGTTEKGQWKCGLEFDYANAESIYCRPLSLPKNAKQDRMPIPEGIEHVSIALLPSMSGLAANETRLDPGAISVRIGEGRTAEVLRNLCYGLSDTDTLRPRWEQVVTDVEKLFGISLQDPKYIPERGEIVMEYKEPSGARLDISSSGRGLQQVVLLLTYLHANPGSVLLLDEPDAHLEILRQRQIYNTLRRTADIARGQIIAASHSEVLLSEAGGKDTVVAFVGRPHRIDDRGSQVLKSLRDIGFEDYYQAEQRGWILYLEGSTDLAVLQEFARRLNHKALSVLESPFVYYVGNYPQKARDHFSGLKEAKPNLVGYALFDRMDKNLQDSLALREWMWSRREIENYLCQKETLLAFAEANAVKIAGGPLLEPSEVKEQKELMLECIEEFAPRAALNNPTDSWWLDVKASDEFLDRVFRRFYEKKKQLGLLDKSGYYRLAEFVPLEFISDDIKEVLDGIYQIATQAPSVSDSVS